MRDTIGITMGDPKGIGPEVIAKSWKLLRDNERAGLVIYGDMAAIEAAGELAGVSFSHKQLVITSSTQPPIQKVDATEAARLAMSAIDAAVNDASSGRIAGIVTAPVNKHRMQASRAGFMGHTEYISKLAGAKDTVMMFSSADFIAEEMSMTGDKQMCFSLVTTHLPMRDVPAAITTEKVFNCIRKTQDALDKYFAYPDARIAVMSLNPHSGEAGALGSEEKNAITPAVERAIEEGINCKGPIAADSLFRNISDFDYDAVVAMYHDQGLVPAKLICQQKCVNITLGLPFIRTSPGHGTAEDIAWLGNADCTSMLAAIRLARRIVGWRVEK